MRTMLISLCLVVLAWPVMAREVQVSGQAFIDASVNLARDQAIEDAMQQASLQAGVQVRSSQLLNMGQLDQDQVQVDARSRVALKRIVNEGRSGDWYQVSLVAEVRPEAMCASSHQQYRKTIAVAGFALVDHDQATLGRIGNVEQSLPQVLVGALNRDLASGVQALDASAARLYGDPRTAPVMENSQQRLTTSVTLATRLGAQYVVSGVVRDLGLTGQSRVLESGQPQKVSWRDVLGLQQQSPERRFAVELFVHDGLSGALLFQRQYQTAGLWNLPLDVVAPFASQPFWHTAYGSEVQRLLNGMTEELAEVMRCQPFMARIVSARGNRLHIEAGAVAGIRPGDRFQVYRTGTFYNLDLEPRTELTNMATEVVIKQVQPQFVVAELSGSAEALSIQRDDLVIAW